MVPQDSSRSPIRPSRSMMFMVLLMVVLAACGATPAAPTATPTTASNTPPALKVALIAPNRIFDKGYIQLSWEGVLLAEKELGAEVKPVEVLEQERIMKNVDDLVSQGFNVIIMVSPQIQAESLAAAQKYPNIHVIGVDHAQSETLPNLTGLIFKEDQAGYLAGTLAALMTKTDKVAAVLGTDEVPQLWAFGEGFKKGVLDQKPSVEVTLVYHNQVPIEKSFIDPEWGRLQANALMDQDADVIFVAAGATGNGALLAMADRKDDGVMGIGVDTDQYLTIPEAQPILLSSTMKQVDQGILTLLKQVQDGTIKGGNFYGSIALAPFHDFESDIPADVKTKVATIQQQLESGELTVVLPERK